jgi:hypothetical protein
LNTSWRSFDTTPGAVLGPCTGPTATFGGIHMRDLTIDATSSSCFARSRKTQRNNLADGLPAEEILASYPSLTLDDIRAAVAYGAAFGFAAEALRPVSSRLQSVGSQVTCSSLSGAKPRKLRSATSMSRSLRAFTRGDLALLGLGALAQSMLRRTLMSAGGFLPVGLT